MNENGSGQDALRDDYYGENGALGKINDLEPFILLAQKMDELSKEGRINDMRRVLVTEFVKMRDAEVLAGQIAGALFMHDKYYPDCDGSCEAFQLVKKQLQSQQKYTEGAL